ncbi:MAG TPA: DnaA N-terminal domain-containing protein, partial [Rubrobacteraceae bacterium]|nr:DnaA N-terminal domain-containing protein [Rubrobacteraceae bacterium]
VAKRLYRLVDLKRDGASSWETDLFDLQRRIPLGPYGYVSKIKEKLKAAHEELQGKGFLSGVLYEGKSGVVYEIAAAFRDRRKGLELAGTREDFIAIKLLTESGVRGDVARDLVAKHGPGTCTRYANALPHQQSLRNPAGWLRRAIEDGYEVQTGPPEQEAVPASEHLEETEDVRPVSSPPDPDRGAQDLFDFVLEDVSTEIDTPSFMAWFQGTVPVSFDGQTLTLSVPNAFAEEYIRTRFADKIEGALRRELGQEASLSLAIYG